MSCGYVRQPPDERTGYSDVPTPSAHFLDQYELSCHLEMYNQRVSEDKSDVGHFCSVEHRELLHQPKIEQRPCQNWENF